MPEYWEVQNILNEVKSLQQQNAALTRKLQKYEKGGEDNP